MKIRKIVAGRALVLILCMSFFQLANARYSMAPLVTILDLSNGITTGEVLISFEGDVKAPVAIELKVKDREVSLDGTKITYHEGKSADDFVIYPSQIVLMPGDKQRVQVKWVGESIPEKEIAYGLIAEEAPIKLGDEDDVRTKPMGRIYMIMRYEGAILLRPAGIKTNTVVDSARSAVDSLGKTKLILTLFNKGTAKQKIKGLKLQVIPLNKKGKVITKQRKIYTPTLPIAQTRQSLFPGYRRQLILPWPKGLPVGPVRVIADFKGKK